MTSSVDTAVQAEVRLRELIARGFQFLYPTDARGELAAIIGVRAHGEVIDVIRLNTEDDAVATRMPSDEEHVLAPTRYSWRTRGPACSVLEELLELPDDRIA
jgi:hypothetical protein